jgi:hypothetical protein
LSKGLSAEKISGQRAFLTLFPLFFPLAGQGCPWPFFIFDCESNPHPANKRKLSEKSLKLALFYFPGLGLPKAKRGPLKLRMEA